MALLDLYTKLPEDKKGHLNLGMLVGLAFGHKPIIGVAVVVAVAVGKELYDYVYNKITKTETHEVSAYDALATMIGGVAGVGVTMLTNYLI